MSQNDRQNQSEGQVSSIDPSSNATAAQPVTPSNDGERIERSAPPAAASDHLQMVELIFFAYRDFVDDADVILEQFGFGRAHHRVLHFVNRNPGLTVAELLDVLKITKQSLGRVLRQLVETGHIVQEAGTSDRRQRLLYPTQKGRNLALALSKPQSRRIESALHSLPKEQQTVVKQFLQAMINDGDLPLVKRMTHQRQTDT